MPSVIKKSIEIHNLDKDFPKYPTIFKQFFKTNNLDLSNYKCPIEELLKVSALSYITNIKIIKTLGAKSLEGQCLNEHKLIVQGNINEKFEYVANISSKPLHVATFNIPFTNFIVLPKSFKHDTHIEVKSYIENTYVELIDNITIFNNISLLLNCNI